jgi:phospholipid/cholesterol/gamma-HCH transport system substrate-binding protein
MVNSEDDSSRERGAGVRSARSTRGQRHPVATTVGVAALVLAVAAIIHYRYGWLFVNGPQYQAAFEEVSGLGEGAEVRYAGLAVGRVRRVSIDPADNRHVLVTFRVHKGTPVRTDTRVAAVSAGSRPASYVNLHPTSTRAPLAPWGTRLETQEGPTVENVLERVTLVLDRTDTLLAAAAPLAHSAFFADFGRVIARVDTLATAASRNADRWGPRLERVVQHTDQLLERTDRIVATLDSARPAIGQAPAEMLATLQESRVLLTELRNGVDQGGGLQAMMQNLATASDDLARLSARLERNPLSALQRRAPARKTTGPAIHD